MSLAQSEGLLVWAEVDLEKLKKNLGLIASKLQSPAVQILAIVKADAYGHGMLPVAQALSEEGVSFFGVANIDEALALREACPAAKILVLGNFHPNQLRYFIEKQIRPTVSTLEDLRLIHKTLRQSRVAFPVHVKVDTGMGRLGVYYREAPVFFERLLRLRNIFVEGIYTHFSSADEQGSEFTDKQISAFNSTIQKIRALGIMPLYFHAANSMGIVRFQKAHLNLVRPGLILYGLNPSKRHPPVKGLEPALSLKTRVSLIKEVPRGATISYGATYRSSKRTRIAVLPVGYSYGYRVGFSNKASVLIRGTRCPVIGRVTMDQVLVDVGNVPDVKQWDEVTLIGKSGSEAIGAEELADLIDTIPYEIVCGLHSRIPRIYRGMRSRNLPSSNAVFQACLKQRTNYLKH